jgi:hypothetical protein
MCQPFVSANRKQPFNLIVTYRIEQQRRARTAAAATRPNVYKESLDLYGEMTERAISV